MTKFLIKWLISIIALLVVVHVFPGVSSTNIFSTIIMALVLGLLNTFLKPLIALLCLPFMILTLGIFMLILNASMFFLAAHLVSGFYVAGFGSALLASMLYSLIIFLLNLMIQSDIEKKYQVSCSTYKSRIIEHKD